MSRQRLHYSKDQIITDLYTYGNEWMYEDTIEYIGPYHKYTTGEIYTEPMWNEKLSKKLIVYQDTTTSKYRYKQIKPDIKTKYKYVNGYSIEVSNTDVANGFVTRYFIKKLNDSNITEIDKKTYDDFNSVIIDPNLYLVISIKWYITGDINTTTKNGITTIGVYDKNKSALLAADKKMPGIISKLPDLIELYRSTGFIIPVDINDPTYDKINSNKSIYVDGVVIDDIAAEMLKEQKRLDDLVKASIAVNSTELGSDTQSL